MSQQRNLALAAGLGAGAVLLLQKLLRRKAERCTVLAVTLKFASIKDRETFKRLWKPLAEYCQAQEPETLSYKFSEGAEDAACFAAATTCFIYERYPTVRDLKEVHDSSPLKLALGDALAKAGCQVEASLAMYTETDLGYADRA